MEENPGKFIHATGDEFQNDPQHLPNTFKKEISQMTPWHMAPINVTYTNATAVLVNDFFKQTNTPTVGNLIICKKHLEAMVNNLQRQCKLVVGS